MQTRLNEDRQVAALTETMKNLQLKHGNKTLCLHFNRTECNDKNCKFAHLCAVRLPNGPARHAGNVARPHSVTPKHQLTRLSLLRLQQRTPDTLQGLMARSRPWRPTRSRACALIPAPCQTLRRRRSAQAPRPPQLRPRRRLFHRLLGPIQSTASADAPLPPCLLAHQKRQLTPQLQSTSHLRSSFWTFSPASTRRSPTPWKHCKPTACSLSISTPIPPLTF